MLDSKYRQLRTWLSDVNRRRLARRHKHRIASQTPSYQEWIAYYETPILHQLAIAGPQEDALDQSLVSILITVHDPELELLKRAINSAITQTHQNCEICIVDNISTRIEVREFISTLSESSDKIKYLPSGANDSGEGTSKCALSLATGHFITALGQEDIIPPYAISILLREFIKSPEAEIFYSDHDFIDGVGKRHSPQFKPDWNHTLALSCDYVDHLILIRREIAICVGGLRQDLNGLEYYDLLLRCSETLKSSQIKHLPLILYHKRSFDENLPHQNRCDPATATIACGIVEGHLRRLNRCAHVSFNGQNCEVKYEEPAIWPHVTVIIPTKDKPDLLRQCLSTVLAKTDYPSLDMCIVDNGSKDPEAISWLANAARDARVNVIRDDSPFNYSYLNNLAVAQTAGDVICLMNNDVEVISPTWLKEMIAELCQPGVGVVGCRLYYPDGTIQHAGVILGLHGTAGHIFRGQSKDDPHYMSRSMLTQELSAVTAACLVTRRDVFQSLGGLDEKFAVAFNDIDYCLRARKQKWKVVYHPGAELIHHESVSRGKDRTKEKRSRLEFEKNLLVSRHAEFIARDPAYNPNLGKLDESARLSTSTHQ